jgi:hypothetical protein
MLAALKIAKLTGAKKCFQTGQADGFPAVLLPHKGGQLAF